MITMAVLFGVCFLQATYWVIDQDRHAQRVHSQLIGLLEDEVRWANQVLDPETRALWSQQHPHLRVVEGQVVIDPARLESLDRERNSRINRYRWEGGFFLVVLLLGTGVLIRTLRQHGILLRRQRNFLASVGHELKSPLASIKLAAETLELRRPDPDSVARISGRMLQDVARLEGFVDNILETSRLDAGSHPLHRQELALEPLVGELVESMRTRYPEVRIDFQREHGATIFADVQATRAVVQNLLDNACKSIRAAAHGHVTVTLRSVESTVHLEVLDEGLGFDPKEASRLFERFYRTGDEMTRTTKGSGLGLYIAHSAMELEGGKLRAHSEGAGMGALFVAEWPTYSRTEALA